MCTRTTIGLEYKKSERACHEMCSHQSLSVNRTSKYKQQFLLIFMSVNLCKILFSVPNFDIAKLSQSSTSNELGWSLVLFLNYPTTPSGIVSVRPSRKLKFGILATIDPKRRNMKWINWNRVEGNNFFC